MEKASLMISNISTWIKNNKKEFLILFSILLLASILRLYKISEYMTFLGDEGRDAIIVRRLLVNFDPILVGPGTSIGNMYLGPLYYYFMAPGLFLANYSPVGPAIQIALLGVVTVFLVWFVGKKFFGNTAGVVAALLFAVAPVVIIYSRSSWNPNIMPFFSLLGIYSIWKVWYEKSFKWMSVLGISFSFALQSHYLGLLLAPVIILFWVLTVFDIKKNKKLLVQLIKHSIFSGIIFLILMSPLVIFDARHGWRNFSAIQKFFSERQTTVSAKPWSSIPKIYPIFEKINTRLMAGYDSFFGRWISVALLSTLLLFIGKNKNIVLGSKNKKAFFLLSVWFLTALIGLGSYKQEIYDHYYGFFFAVPFLIFGGLSQTLIDSSRIRGKSLVILSTLIILAVNLVNNPLKYSPNKQLDRSVDVANKIIEVSDNKKFNLAVIAERNYDAAYRYFLETNKALVVDIDPQNTKDTITDQLFVVCEMEAQKCDPTHNPKAEVANFGWSKIENQWSVSGVLIYKLVHSQ